MHIDMTNTFQMGKNRHARFVLHAPDQIFAAAGTITSILPSSPPSIMPTAARSVLGTSCTLSGSSPPPPARAKNRHDGLRRLQISELPRKITAFPAFRHKAAASAVTLGRLSKSHR